MVQTSALFSSRSSLSWRLWRVVDHVIRLLLALPTWTKIASIKKGLTLRSEWWVIQNQDHAYCVLGYHEDRVHFVDHVVHLLVVTWKNKRLFSNNVVIAVGMVGLVGMVEIVKIGGFVGMVGLVGMMGIIGTVGFVRMVGPLVSLIDLNSQWHKQTSASCSLRSLSSRRPCTCR